MEAFKTKSILLYIGLISASLGVLFFTQTQARNESDTRVTGD